MLSSADQASQLEALGLGAQVIANNDLGRIEGAPGSNGVWQRSRQTRYWRRVQRKEYSL